MKRLLYSGIVILFALSLAGGAFAQPTAQVQISNITLSPGRDAMLVTVTVVSSSHDDRKNNYLITLTTQLMTKNGYVFTDFKAVAVHRDQVVVHVFRVPFHISGQYLFTANVYALPSMQLLGTASADPPAVGRD